MNKLAINRSLLAGVIGGIILTGFSFGTYYSGIDSFFSFKMIYNFLPIVTIVILLLGFGLKKQMGGFIAFKEVLQYALVAYLIYEIFAAITSYLLFVVIDPMLTEKLKNKGLEVAQHFMASSGKTPEEISKDLSGARVHTETTSFKNIFLGFGMFLILDFMLSLLIAIIVKKERPADLDYTPQTIL